MKGKILLKSLNKSIELFFADKKLRMCSLVPIFLGILFYLFLGYRMWGWVQGINQYWLGKLIGLSFLSSVFTGIASLFLGVTAYFLISWTFVIFVSLVASPFNDYMSGRVEFLLRKKETPAFEWKKIVKIIFNELKKVFFILFFSFIAFIFTYIPYLTPLGYFFTSILLAVSFLDYNWSRHFYNLLQCYQDFKKDFLTYLLPAVIMFPLFSIPLLNLLLLPFATVYFAVLWTFLNHEG